MMGISLFGKRNYEQGYPCGTQRRKNSPRTPYDGIAQPKVGLKLERII
jgi:hypothetical protein